MKKVGFLTYDKYPNLCADDRHLIEPFKQAGIEIIPIIWNEQKDYTNLDLLVFKSLWNYHHNIAAFREWLDFLETQSIPVFNPVSIIKENFDKSYLKDLQEKGFSVIPTLFFDKVDQVDLKQIVREQGWQRGVIKPIISMSAYKTYAFDINNIDSLQQNLKTDYGDERVMVQKFMPEITEEGEWSLIFYNGKYCMTALKSPQKGDFRVQSELGGTISYVDPPQHIIDEAKAILDYYGDEILYARVDGIIHNQHFQLMEIELIDPELYFRAGKKGQIAFLNAIKERLAGFN